MPEPDEYSPNSARKSLGRRGMRNVRRVQLTKLEWRGRGLRMLAIAEKELVDDFNQSKGDYSARCAIARTLFQLLDTRRMVVGDPLPGTLRPSKQTTYEAWKDAAVPALPCPVSSSLAQATGFSPPTQDHVQSVQSEESVAPTLDPQNGEAKV